MRPESAVSPAAFKTAIEKQRSMQFASSCKAMLEGIRPMIPQTQVQSILTFDPTATWPH